MLWKIWRDSFTDDFQERMLKEAIENKEYLYVLGTNEWKIPIHHYKANLTTSTKTKIDILKKMIMFTFLNMNIKNLEELCDILKVDSLFIEDIVKQMLVTGVVEKNKSSYTLTSIGKSQFKAGTILSEPIREELSFQYSVMDQEALPEEQTNQMIKEDWLLETYRYAKNDESLEGQVLDEKSLRTLIQESGQVFEIGNHEKIISKINPLILQRTQYAKCIEYQLYDLVEDKVYARIWNGAIGRWDEQFEKEVTNIEGSTWKEQYDQDIIEHFPERYDYLKQKMIHKDNNNENALVILRGKDIRQKFLHSFSATKQKMLMVSPWISSAVVDKDMFARLSKFAQEGKTLYISWGISKSIDKEDRKPNKELLEKIQNIVHEDGTQAIFIRWFGNQHNKEIVVDDKMHLLGSFNWLSYRGEYDIRHESVVVMKDKKVIQDTTVYIEEKFIHALEDDLNVFLVKDPTEIDEKDVKNWMKELIILSSAFEKRKQLSDQLINHLRQYDNRQALINILAILWARYDKEDFGVMKYLEYLLKNEKYDQATEYLSICQKYMRNLDDVIDSPEMLAYKDWLLEKLPKKNMKKQPRKKKTSNQK